MEDLNINKEGKYIVDVADCYLSKDDNDKYFIFFLFKTEDGRTISSRQYLSSEKQVEFVERTLKSAFNFSDRETIDSIIDKIESIKGQSCLIVVENKSYIDRNGDEKTTVSVKWINALGTQRVESSDFKSRLRAIRSGKYSSQTKNAGNAPF